MDKQPVDLAAVRQHLAGKHGPEYWRALEEVAETSEFRDVLHNEFPPLASEWTDPVSRRNFIKLMAASFALAGLTTACNKAPREQILPYVKSPENVIPGRPLFFASSMAQGGYGHGLLVKSHMGRPTKIEGNPDHPASLGSSNIFAQASLLNLYDPDRSQNILYRGRIATWGQFTAAMATALASLQLNGGKGLRVLTETVTSPTLGAQMAALKTQLPEMQWHQYEPVNLDNVRSGAELAFGSALNTVYDFSKADVVLSLDSDFLSELPGSVRYARDFADRRRVTGGKRTMNRLYVVESVKSLAGGMADHRLPLQSRKIEAVARSLASVLGVKGATGALPEGVPQAWFDAVVADLQAHRGSSLVVPGVHQPAAVHALAHAINEALGNVGTTVRYTEPVEVAPVHQGESLRALVADMKADQEKNLPDNEKSVQVLFILGGNPVYNAPVDLEFAKALDSVPLRVHLGHYQDETAELCHWHIPKAHFLEAWGDVRSYDGTVSIIQPLIAPLYDGRTDYEMLGLLVGQAGATPYEIVRNQWKAQFGAQGDTSGFDAFWDQTVHDGVMANTAFPTLEAKVNIDFATLDATQALTPNTGLEVVFRPDPSIGDGEYANNGWLQELPKPFTKVAWGNILAVSPATAESLGVKLRGNYKSPYLYRDTELFQLECGGRSVVGPLFIVPGQADGTVVAYLGFGRRRGGAIATGKTVKDPLGYNAYDIRVSQAPWMDGGATLRGTGKRVDVACTQLHFQMPDHRGIMRSATLEEFKANEAFVMNWEHGDGSHPSIYPEWKYEGYSWGMSIDQNTCIGCNACIVACVAENNIPVVGRDQVIMGREMHWIRIDTYYQGDADNPSTHYQPMLCQHCEKAPCEPVCPVGATVHSSEGLNDMVYNRCVGTRYCSNNCPYKVRRFNFLQYSDLKTESLKPMRNPDVTVRTRGVMEKCTYCVQRINAARIEAKKSGRRIQDGEVITACQAACPTQAIVFGDINDANSRVSRLKSEPTNYKVLGDLNTKPRTTYLARLTNPNPALAPETTHAAEAEVH